VDVRWTRPALADLAELRRYVGERNRTAARQVASRILASIKHLRRHRALGRPGRVPGTRELVITGTPYVVPYRVNGDTLELLRVLHGARRWPSR
jgi:toxin ParE1/3/4